MKNKNIKLFFSITAVVGIAFSFFTFSSFTNKKVNTFQKVNNTSQWENLKVLPDDISKDDLLDMMKEFNVALGVDCTHCHAPRKDDPKKLDFADDSKMEKHIARGMIQMTQEINENYFKPYKEDPKPEMVEDVSCVMCHRGSAKPKQYLDGLGKMFKEKQEDE